MEDYKLFEQIRNLFNTSDKALDIFSILKYHSQFGNDNKEIYLYICPNEQAVDKWFKETMDELNSIKYYINCKIEYNHHTKLIIVNNYDANKIETYRAMPIKRIANGIDGLRFTKIRFYE